MLKDRTYKIPTTEHCKKKEKFRKIPLVGNIAQKKGGGLDPIGKALSVFPLGEGRMKISLHCNEKYLS